MNVENYITDEEFVPFLHSLGVETHKKSFEWMLNDPDYAGVLRWLYNNLDHNNALTAREEYRYIEIQKKGTLLSADDLESSIASIQEKHPGICLPGDQEAKEDVKQDISMLKERLNVLEKQETIVNDLITQNNLTKEELSLELTRLHSAYQHCTEDEAAAAEECTALAQELETITDEVIDVVAKNLEMYASCKGDKETAKRFLIFSPLESYRQSQALFRSHFDLYVSKNLTNRQNDITNEDCRAVLAEAKILEERLSDAAFAYFKSEAELSGEQAKLALITTASRQNCWNYNNGHPSQITSRLLEAQSALDLLEQEENIVVQQVQNAVDDLVKTRTDLAVNSATMAALNVRLQIHNSLTHLTEVWQRAITLDRLLYYLLRHELRNLEEFLQFASHLRQYAVSEASAVASRIESMSEICAEHSSVSLKLQSSNPLLHALCTILGVSPTNDASAVVKVYNELGANLKELSDIVDDEFRKKEDVLIEFKNSTKPLHDYIWSGSTKQANCWDRTVAALSHSLRQQMASVDKRVVEASGLFTSVKNGDKHNLRKLWQWFLTDPPRLLAAMKNCRSF